MKIIVCLKQVPDAANVSLDPETHTLKREGVAAIINPFDLFALEAGLRLRDAVGATITVLSMGPPQAEEALKDAIGYGVDEAVLLSDRAFAGADTWATTAVLAKAIEKLGGADLIICGKQAVDGDTAQVGPGIAARLNLPQVAFVKGWRQVEEKRMVVERQLDEGFDVVEMPLPAVMTVVREVGEPRPQSLKSKMKARGYKPVVWGAADLGLAPEDVGLAGSFTQVVEVFPPPAGGIKEQLYGTPEEMGASVIERLIERKILIIGG